MSHLSKGCKRSRGKLPSHLFIANNFQSLGALCVEWHQGPSVSINFTSPTWLLHWKIVRHQPPWGFWVHWLTFRQQQSGWYHLPRYVEGLRQSHSRTPRPQAKPSRLWWQAAQLVPVLPIGSPPTRHDTRRHFEGASCNLWSSSGFYTWTGPLTTIA